MGEAHGVQLVGMLDSPYVRRVAIALLHSGAPFEHRPLSLFRHIEAFAAINPALRAPTFVADDGTVLMESGLILDYVASFTPRLAALTPADPALFVQSCRLNGLALAACEKAVQLHYENSLRPPEKQHEPWRARVKLQFVAALAALETSAGKTEGWLLGPRLSLADISVACAYGFARHVMSDPISAEQFPHLDAFCQRAEALPEFRAAPPRDGFVAGSPPAEPQ